MREYLQQVFNAYTGGVVYKYMATIPDGVDPIHYVTERFTGATGNNTLTTTVCDLGPSKGILLYVEEGDVLKNSNEFGFVDDLTPTPVAWSPEPPAPEPSPEPTPPQEGQ